MAKTSCRGDLEGEEKQKQLSIKYVFNGKKKKWLHHHPFFSLFFNKTNIKSKISRYLFIKQ